MSKFSPLLGSKFSILYGKILGPPKMLILRHFFSSLMRNTFTSYAFSAQKKNHSRLFFSAADRIRTCIPFQAGGFQDRCSTIERLQQIIISYKKQTCLKKYDILYIRKFHEAGSRFNRQFLLHQMEHSCFRQTLTKRLQ